MHAWHISTLHALIGVSRASRTLLVVVVVPATVFTVAISVVLVVVVVNVVICGCGCGRAFGRNHHGCGSPCSAVLQLHIRFAFVSRPHNTDLGVILVPCSWQLGNVVVITCGGGANSE